MVHDSWLEATNAIYGTTDAFYGTTNADAGVGIGMKMGGSKKIIEKAMN